MEKEKVIASFPLRLIIGGLLLFNSINLSIIGLGLTFPNDQWGPGEDPPPSFIGQLLLILICFPSFIAFIALLLNNRKLPALLLCIGVALLAWTLLLKLKSGEYFLLGTELYGILSFVGLTFAAIGYYTKREFKRQERQEETY